MASQTSTRGGVSGGFLLFLVFLVLKLTDVIGWSWWWVTAPLWVPVAIGVLLLTVAGVLALFAKGGR